MKRISLFFLLLACYSFSFTQAQVSNNLTKLGQVDNNSLPVFFGIAYNEVWGWADTTNGREYAILGSLEWTYFIEVTDPFNPVVRDSVQGKYANAIHRDFKTYKNYCYGVADEGNTTSTLQVMDMSYLPDSVHVVFDSDTFFNRAHNIFIDEPAGRLYTVGSPTQSQGCILLDVATDPENPTLLSNLNLGQYAHDLYVRNDTAYFNCGNQGLYIYDYTNPTAPLLIGVLTSYVGKGYNHSSWLTEDGNSLVLADETHNKPCKIVDVSDMQNLNVVSTFKSTLLAPADTASIPHNPVVAGKYACVSYYHDGLQLYDVSNPVNPINVAWYDTDLVSTNYGGYKGCWGVYPLLPSGHILASDVQGGLYVLGANFPFPYELSAEFSHTNIDCYGAGNGTAAVEANWGGRPYTYAWSNGDTTESVFGLAPGIYTVTVSDTFGYSVIDTFTISEPGALAAPASAQAISCPGLADGAIDLTISGGVAPYQILWSTGDTVEDLTGLGQGNFSFVLTDANGCQVLDTISVGLGNVQPVADAGNNSKVCKYPFFLNAQPANVGTGSWSVLSGNGNLANSNAPVTNVTGLSLGLNTLSWTVVNGPCIAADTISLILYGTAGTFAGPDAQICGDIGQLTGNTPVAGTGTWTLVSGSGNLVAPTLPSTMVNGLTPGTSQFAWTVIDGPCIVGDTLTWNVDYLPTPGFTSLSNQLVVSFTDNSSYGTSWLWNFGNGITSTFQQPTHTYTQPGSYTVCQWVTNVCGTDSICNDVEVTSVGFEEGFANGLKVYPNPTNGRVLVDWEAIGNGPVAFSIFDVEGQRVWSKEVPSRKKGLVLELNKLGKGFYFLEMIQEGKRISRKIILE